MGLSHESHETNTHACSCTHQLLGLQARPCRHADFYFQKISNLGLDWVVKIFNGHIVFQK